MPVMNSHVCVHCHMQAAVSCFLALFEHFCHQNFSTSRWFMNWSSPKSFLSLSPSVVSRCYSLFPSLLFLPCTFPYLVPFPTLYLSLAHPSDVTTASNFSILNVHLDFLIVLFCFDVNERFVMLDTISHCLRVLRLSTITGRRGIWQKIC